MTDPRNHPLCTTPYGFETTADDVIAGLDLSGKRAIVTGGASGIGVETARALSAAGADVTIAARRLQAAHAVAQDISAKAHGRVEAARLDLVDRDSIAAFVSAWTGALDILVNNAGVMALPELHRSPEGWELQFATNHLGHFELAVGLHPALKAADGARIVSLSSNAHRSSPIVFDDVHFENRPYDEWSAYGQSKTANSLFAVEAATRWAGDGIVANAVMPGGIRTNLQQHQLEDPTPEIKEIFDNYNWKTVEQGAATSVLLAASPLVAGVTGRYFEDGNEAQFSDDPSAGSGVRAHAIDPEAASRLWDYSVALLGL